MATFSQTMESVSLKLQTYAAEYAPKIEKEAKATFEVVKYGFVFTTKEAIKSPAKLIETVAKFAAILFAAAIITSLVAEFNIPCFFTASICAYYALPKEVSPKDLSIAVESDQHQYSEEQEGYNANRASKRESEFIKRSEEAKAIAKSDLFRGTALVVMTAAQCVLLCATPVGIAVQLTGSYIYFNHYLSVAKEFALPTQLPSTQL